MTLRERAERLFNAVADSICERNSEKGTVAIESALIEYGNAQLEEAAKLLDEIHSSKAHENCRKHYAERIRALKTPEGK